MYKDYENLCNELEREVSNIEKQKGLTKESLEQLYYITGTIDNLKNLMMVEDSGMSGRSYYDDMSGARRRDSRGRYMDSGQSYDGRSYDGGRSYDNGRYGRNYEGYSRDNSRKKMVQKLETLMDDTMSENERRAIQDCIEKIQ